MKKHPRKCAKPVIVMAIFCLALAWAAASARATAIAYQFVPAKSSLARTPTGRIPLPKAGIRVEFQLPQDRVME